MLLKGFCWVLRQKYVQTIIFQKMYNWCVKCVNMLLNVYVSILLKLFARFLNKVFDKFSLLLLSHTF